MINTTKKVSLKDAVTVTVDVPATAPKVTKVTIARFAVLILALLNQVLTAVGKNPFPYSDTQVYDFITYAFTVVASLWAWWKNNDFTSFARKVDTSGKQAVVKAEEK